jgi:hypothetical protein
MELLRKAPPMQPARGHFSAAPAQRLKESNSFAKKLLKQS